MRASLLFVKARYNKVAFRTEWMFRYDRLVSLKKATQVEIPLNNQLPGRQWMTKISTNGRDVREVWFTQLEA